MGSSPSDLLERADAEIDGLIEAEAPNGVQEPGQHAWFPKPERLPRCDDVLRLSPALEIAEELVAPARLDHAFDHIQVATTVPRWAHVPGGPHIDGHAPGQDPPHSFTLLAGVPLTDQRRSQTGNLWVWPGSHLHHQRLFHERGSKVLLETGGHSTLLDPPLALSPPVELRARHGVTSCWPTSCSATTRVGTPPTRSAGRSTTGSRCPGTPDVGSRRSSTPGPTTRG